MEREIHRHTISFRHAFNGLAWAFRTQPNFKIHLVFTVLVVGAGFFFAISKTEWLILILTISWILTTELANTAVEVATDLLVERKWSQLAKIAKDVSSGAVLLTAFGAVIVGLFIFGPRIYSNILGG